MSRIERKAHYVGTWREDVVTDATMRQIVARSQAEKGQKVKVKLSKSGLGLSRTVLFQESVLSNFSLADIYFLTVNPRHPTCLVCIVADLVRKYLILAIRTASSQDALDIIDTFQLLKNNPTLERGNILLKRKENGKWTLRERSQHNADRHMRQVFREASLSSSSSSTHAYSSLPQPNGAVITGTEAERDRARVNSGSQTALEGSEEEVALMKMEMETLSQELHELKLVLENAAAPVSPRTFNNNNTNIVNNNTNTSMVNNNTSTNVVNNNTTTNTISNNTSQQHHQNTEKSHYVSGIYSSPDQMDFNEALVSARSDGGVYYADRPGEVRAIVKDHRGDGRVRSKSQTSQSSQSHERLGQIGDTHIQPNIAQSNGLHTIHSNATHMRAQPLNGNVRVHRQITVPEPNSSPQAVNGFGEVSASTLPRNITRQIVRVPFDRDRMLSSPELHRSSVRVKFHPQTRFRGNDRQFQSMRVSRKSGVPTTIVRPIEETYTHGNVTTVLRRHPVMLVSPQTYALHHQQSSGLYAQPQQPMSAVYISKQAQRHPTSSMYVTQEIGYSGRPVTSTNSVGRSNRQHVQLQTSHVQPTQRVQDGEESAWHRTGELDDVLL